MFDWLFDPVKDTKPYWMEFVSPTVTLLLAGIGYWWSIRVWKVQKALEVRLAAGQHREASRIAACKAVWGLLAYMSEKENSKTVFVARGDEQKKTWHLRREQGIDYINQVERVFFGDGHGIFMPKDIRDGMYEFRSRIYRLLEKESRKGNEDSFITIENEEVVQKVKELFAQLNQRLREEIAKNPEVSI